MTHQPQLDLTIPPPPTPHPTQPGNLPRWAAAQIEDNRPGNPAHRGAALHRCRDCDQLVISGLDDDLMAQTVTADPTPIDPREEIACHLTGRPTYAAWRTADGYELTRRRERELVTRNAPVIPAHRCGARFPTFLIDPAPEARDTSSTPPF